MKFNNGDIIHGFRVTNLSHIQEVDSDAYLMQHEKSGARLLYLANNDDNKVFFISFRTTPDNSKGTPHIMEHSTLCGSRKFPLKEPFVELAKGSLNTFLNAITWPDKTMYPIASDRGTGSRRQESEWAGYEGSEREAIGNDARLDPGTAARIAKAARWLTGDHRPGLLLYGTVGSGKSTLARAICELIGILHDSPLRSERLAVARTSAPELVELKAAREVRAAADSEELFARLRGAPMLLIDDLGVEATAVRSWGNCLTPVIDLLYYRYDRRLFTIVTSNLDQEAIEATYGVRIADRMAEMFDRIGHAGPSYRR